MDFLQDSCWKIPVGLHTAAAFSVAPPAVAQAMAEQSRSAPGDSEGHGDEVSEDSPLQISSSARENDPFIEFPKSHRGTPSHHPLQWDVPL